MELTLTSKHELLGGGYFIGIDNENLSEQLIINIEPDELLDKWAYIEFQVNDGDKYNTQRLDIVDRQIVYAIQNGVLEKGYIEIQVIFRDDTNYVWKSYKKKFHIGDAINACQNLPDEYPDFITEAQKLLDEIAVDADKVDEVLATEQARIEAEAIRVENENTRIANENNRIAAEQTRSTAETERMSNETTRKSNELARVTAETERETKFNTWENTLGVLDNLSNALKNTASGEVIRVDDVSPVEHNAKVKVQGKNLLNINAMLNDNLIVNEDGSYTLTKTESDRFSKTIDIEMLAGTSYTLSASLVEGTASMLYFQFYMIDGTTKSFALDSTTFSRPMTFASNVYKIRLYINIEDAVASYIHFDKLQIKLGDTATEYTPYVDPTSVTVTRCGKNLLEPSGSKSQNGITLTMSEEGIYTISGTTTSTFTLKIGNAFLKAGQRYKPTTIVYSGTIQPAYWNYKTQSNIYLDKDGCISVDEDTEISSFIHFETIGEVLNAKFAVIVELKEDDVVVDYEPYKGITYTPNADGTLTIASTAPTMTLITDKDVNINLEYNQDINVVIKSLQDKINALTK